MNRCPDPSDLQSFFGVAGVTEDGKGGDWFYDRIRFTHVGPAGRTTCTILPGEGQFAVEHVQGGAIHLDVALRHVVSLDLESSAGTQLLIGRVSGGSVEQLFKLRLAPEFSFSLTTSLEG